MPQKYAQDGQLGSWVANIRSKRKQLAKRGEEFEPDVAPDGDEDVDDDNNDYGGVGGGEDDDDDALLAAEDEEDAGVGGGGGGGGGGGVGVGGGGGGRRRRRRNGGRQRLTRDRVERLDGIGFQWVVANPNTKSWEERFEDLREYQQTHGSTRVPRSSGTLGEWVHMQVSIRKIMFLFVSNGWDDARC